MGMRWMFCKSCADVAQAKDILDRDHYGLDDVKQRILELIAVGSLRGTVQGSHLLCCMSTATRRTAVFPQSGCKFFLILTLAWHLIPTTANG
eukprot:4690594-Amphidinium_carterae.1